MSISDEHASEARRFAASAEAWMDADTGWRGALSTAERIVRRSTDLQAAQVHATLAQAAMARELLPVMADLAEWVKAGCPVPGDVKPDAALPAAAEGGGQ